MKKAEIIGQSQKLHSTILKQIIGHEDIIKNAKRLFSNIKQLSKLRNIAYPVDKSSSTQEDKDIFAKHLKEKVNLSKTIREHEQNINTLKKQASATRYLEVIINESSILADKNFNIVSISLSDNLFSYTVLENGKLIKKNLDFIQDFNEIQEISRNIEKTADKIIVFNREPIEKEISDLFINFNIKERDSKFLSIQHLLRNLTEFNLKPLNFFCDVFECPDIYTGSDALMYIYLRATGNGYYLK